MRPVLYASLALLLVLFAALGVQQATSFRAATELRERDAAREQLERYADGFQDRVLDKVRFWLMELRGPVDLRGPSEYLRSTVPWFDAFYQWEAGEVSWPSEPPVEDLAALRADPCITSAGEIASADPVKGGIAYLACLPRGTAVGLFAASEASELFITANRLNYAERAVKLVDPYPRMPLAEAAERGVSPRRTLLLRLQLARAATLGGEDAFADNTYARSAEDLLTSDAPVLESVLDLYHYPIASDLRKLRRLPPEADGEVDEGLARAERRIAAWREIKTRTWNPTDAPSIQEGPRAIADPYGDPPWVLLYARTEVNNMLAAVQVDQNALVASFLADLPRAARRAISVRDPAGRVVAGRTEPLYVSSNLAPILPHLTVGFTEDVAPDSGARRQLVVQLIPVLLGVVVGALALFGLVRSDREQVRLLERQREFMARVTHELKTPLAGMRLMAENLEMGAYGGREDVEAFAGRIMSEADRLTLRVDEIIRAASGPAREDPSEFEPARLAEEVAEEWRPRVTQVGGELSVEIKETGRARARRALLRDALVNLLDNALKYRHADRPLRVRLRVVGDRRNVWFEVIDNGMGVPPSMRKVIFERFRRVEGPGRGKSGGHGLGLSFVAEAAAAHGGKVECRDGDDGGSRFTLRIRRRS